MSDQEIIYVSDQMAQYAKRKLADLPQETRDIVETLVLSECIRQNIKPSEDLINALRRTARTNRSPVLKAHMCCLADMMEANKTV